MFDRLWLSSVLSPYRGESVPLCIPLTCVFQALCQLVEFWVEGSSGRIGWGDWNLGPMVLTLGFGWFSSKGYLFMFIKIHLYRHTVVCHAYIFWCRNTNTRDAHIDVIRVICMQTYKPTHTNFQSYMPWWLPGPGEFSTALLSGFLVGRAVPPPAAVALLPASPVRASPLAFVPHWATSQALLVACLLRYVYCRCVRVWWMVLITERTTGPSHFRPLPPSACFSQAGTVNLNPFQLMISVCPAWSPNCVVVCC